MATEEDSSALSLLAALGIGAGTYAAMRKFRPSSIPKLRELQEAAEKGGFSAHFDVPGLKPSVKKIADAAVSGVFGVPVNKKAAAQLNLFQQPDIKIKAKEIVNPSEIVEEFAGKGAFAQTAQDFMPKTMQLSRALKEARKPEMLKKLMGDYIVKPEHGSLEKLSDFVTHSDVLAKTPKAKAAFINPDKFAIQQKLPSKNEYRVHLIDGQPYGISYRYLPKKLDEITKGRGGGLIPVFNRAKRQELSEFMQKYAAGTKWGNLPKGQHAHAAYDILETPQGLKIIDANPAPATMLNPLNSRQLARLMTGRWGHDVSALAGLGTGGISYAGMEAINGR